MMLGTSRPGEDSRLILVNYSSKICLYGFEMKTMVSRNVGHANFTTNVLFNIDQPL